MSDDAIDIDVLPVFLEEGHDLLPRISAVLRKLSEAPDDGVQQQELQRLLHTLKGSARMAGAFRLGQQIHSMEGLLHQATGAPAVALLQQLMEHFDAAVRMFMALDGQMQSPAAASAVPDGEGQPDGQASAGRNGDEQSLATVRIDVQRVGDLLDQVGEISIAYSQHEARLGEFAVIKDDMQQCIQALQSFVREVEILSETQMQAGLQYVQHDEQFDPLEMDRFTHLYELMRRMKESIGDIETLQRSLVGVGAAVAEQVKWQSGLLRDLQHDLMQLRMVPFNSIEERLHYQVRQVAREENKQVKLVIVGGDVAVDRDILEKVTEVLSHWLGNAIVHGVELPQARVSAGKPAAGQLRIVVRQERDDITLECTDDGGGIDPAVVLQRAVEIGLVEPDAVLSEAEILQILFQPGFSMAPVLTERAGRGVGMDVMRSNITALGGYLSIDTELGKGVCMTLFVPMTRALEKVLLVRVQGRTFAVPTELISKVVRVKELEDKQGLAAGHISMDGSMMPVYALASQLGIVGEGEQEACELGLVIGSGADRFLLLVSSTKGAREVVIKPAGIQLAHVVGIVGVTVLGTGEIVLIVHPARLAQREQMSSGIVVAQRPAAPPLPEVMVVDDSLTVRRVTGKMLEREGFRVRMARDGMDALLQLEQSLPAIVLVDLEMPRMDGFELIKKIRAMAPSLPVVMITTRSAAKHRKKAMALGANAFFGKPYQQSKLLSTMRRLLQEVGIIVGG